MEDLNAIIKGCIGNDHKYQKMVYERYYGFAFKIAYRYIYRYDKVADVVNDSFVKVFKSFHVFVLHDHSEVEKCLMGWMKRIIINTAIDELRKMDLMPEIGNLPDNIGQEKDSSQEADQLLLYKELITVIKRLPPAYRAVFNMYVIDGYTHAEIGNMLGISVGTSKSNLFKAKAFLQKLINKDHEQAGICNI